MTCCVEYTDLEDQLVEDNSTICGDTLQAFDLASLLTVTEIADNPVYEILFSGGNYVNSISLNGSIVEITLKNPDQRPYQEVVIASLQGDNFKYKVRVKTKFKDRCEDVTCPSGDACNPCTGDCETGIVDASISIEEPQGNTDLSISII